MLLLCKKDFWYIITITFTPHQEIQRINKEEKFIMNENKDLKFVLFHPVSICIRDKKFKYGIKDNMSYPCLLGFITEDNKCVEVISGRKFDIISQEDRERCCKYYVEITKDSKILENPVEICRWIDNSLENLHLIEKYIDAKGNLSQREIVKSSDFRYRLNCLLFNRPSSSTDSGIETGFYGTLKRFRFSKSYLKKIDIENIKALKEIVYILSGQKESDELTEKNDIIFRLTKKLTTTKKFP